MIAYKLTDEKMQTRGGCQWALGETTRAKGKVFEPYTDGCLHLYESPEVVAFMAPLHGVENYTRCFRVCTGRQVLNDGTKIGVRSATPLEEVLLPKPTLEQRIYFVIQASLKFPQTPDYVAWADDWKSGRDRSYASACAAAYRADARPAAWSASAYIATEAAFRAAIRDAPAYAAAHAKRVDPTIDLHALACEALAWIDPVGVK